VLTHVRSVLNRQLQSAAVSELEAQALCAYHVSIIMSQAAVPHTPHKAAITQPKQQHNTAFVMMQWSKFKADQSKTLGLDTVSEHMRHIQEMKV